MAVGVGLDAAEVLGTIGHDVEWHSYAGASGLWH